MVWVSCLENIFTMILFNFLILSSCTFTLWPPDTLPLVFVHFSGCTSSLPKVSLLLFLQMTDSMTLSQEILKIKLLPFLLLFDLLVIPNSTFKCPGYSSELWYFLISRQFSLNILSLGWHLSCLLETSIFKLSYTCQLHETGVEHWSKYLHQFILQAI